jgi:tRNA acetyltransferase TAN1
MNTEKFDLIVRLEEENKPQEYYEEIVVEQIEDKLKNYDSRYFIKESEYFNIFMVELDENELQTAVKIAHASQPNKLEMIPIESVVPTKPEIILQRIINISKEKILDGETFKIQCNIRGRYIKTKDEFISSVVRELVKLNGKQDESNPDWTINIEVLGESTGVSVLRNL